MHLLFFNFSSVRVCMSLEYAYALLELFFHFRALTSSVCFFANQNFRLHFSLLLLIFYFSLSYPQFGINLIH